jgi:uncharacterized repeat protein (TIGR02543 family)
MRKKNVRIGPTLLLALMAALSLILTACPQATGNDNGGTTNCTVTFDTGGGSAIAPVMVDAGSTVNKPEDPAKEGCLFDNWYTAATAGSVVSWPLTVSENTTVYARRTEAVIPGTRFTVTFDTGGGSAIAPATVDAGSIVNQPAYPAKEGFYFDNWYTAEIDGSVVNWPLTVSENTTVYARWILIGQGSIQVTFSGLPQDETTNLTGMSDGTLSWTMGTLNLSVPSENFSGASWQWYLDGVPLSGETSSSLHKPGADFTLGRHGVTVRIMPEDNQVYSKSVRFTVEQ